MSQTLFGVAIFSKVEHVEASNLLEEKMEETERPWCTEQRNLETKIIEIQLRLNSMSL